MQDVYLDFVEERHRIWELRQAGAPQPWTEDPILASRKFTNVFRVLDHGSQYLLGMLQELDDPRERLARAFLYRHTGRPEPWEFFELMHGRYPLLEDLELVLKTWQEYRGEAKIRTRKKDPKNSQRTHQTDYPRSVFTPAYLVFPQSAVPGTDKLESIVDLTRRLFVEGDTAEQFLAATSQRARFAALRRNKGVADFMSMQILTDFGYTTEDRENEFVVAGPGAVNGAALLFPQRNPTWVINWAREQILASPGCPMLGSRQPSLMDVQNTLCEFSKYARFLAGGTSQGGFRTDIYKPAHPGPQPEPLLPKDWS